MDNSDATNVAWCLSLPHRIARLAWYVAGAAIGVALFLDTLPLLIAWLSFSAAVLLRTLRSRVILSPDSFVIDSVLRRHRFSPGDVEWLDVRIPPMGLRWRLRGYVLYVQLADANRRRVSIDQAPHFEAHCPHYESFVRETNAALERWRAKRGLAREDETTRQMYGET